MSVSGLRALWPSLLALRHVPRAGQSLRVLMVDQRLRHRQNPLPANVLLHMELEFLGGRVRRIVASGGFDQSQTQESSGTGA